MRLEYGVRLVLYSFRVCSDRRAVLAEVVHGQSKDDAPCMLSPFLSCLYAPLCRAAKRAHVMPASETTASECRKMVADHCSMGPGKRCLVVQQSCSC